MTHDPTLSPPGPSPDGGGGTRSHDTKAASSQPTSRWRALAPLTLGIVGIVASLRLPVGALSSPGPGAWPLVVSVGLSTAGAWILLRGTISDQEPIPQTAALRVSTAVISLVVFTALFPVLGLTLPAMALLLVWITGLGGVRWTHALLISVVAALSIHAVFVELLAVPLPLDALFLFSR